MSSGLTVVDKSRFIKRCYERRIGQEANVEQTVASIKLELLIRCGLVVVALISLIYLVMKEHRRPLERLTGAVCAAVTLYLALFTGWFI